MKKKILNLASLLVLIFIMLAGCGRAAADTAQSIAEAVASEAISLIEEADGAAGEAESAPAESGRHSVSESEDDPVESSEEGGISDAGNEEEAGVSDAPEESAEEASPEEGETSGAPQGSASESTSAESTSAESTPAESTPAESVSSESSAEEETGLSVDEDGWYSSKEEVALYLHLYGKLPGNFLTKKEAEELGWDKSYGSLWKVAPGMSIGGSRFGNYEKLLPEKKGRKYYECDIGYNGKTRGAKRIVYSNDGLVYYTGDHYESFELLYGEP